MLGLWNVREFGCHGIGMLEWPTIHPILSAPPRIHRYNKSDVKGQIFSAIVVLWGDFRYTEISTLNKTKGGILKFRRDLRVVH